MTPLLFALGLAAADPGTPAKEPAYAATPRYALLTFGPQAAGRVWLALDGETLCVDRNGNGDLTDPGERVRRYSLVGSGPEARSWFDVGDVTAAGVTYPRVAVMTQTLRDGGGPAFVYGRVWAGAAACTHVAFRLAAAPRAAPVAAVGGPLTLRLDGKASATAGAEYPFSVRVGTPGRGESLRRGKGVFASLYCLPPEPSAGAPPQSPRHIAADLSPVAVFEFPCRSAGCPPVRVEATIDRRCCGDEFLGTVRVPEEAAPGPATVTLSFPAWPAGTVAPATAEIAVVEPK